MPRLRDPYQFASLPSELLAEATPTAEEPEPEPTFDPGVNTVAAVKAYATAHPEEVQRLLEAEEDGQNRTTLLNYLEALL